MTMRNVMTNINNNIDNNINNTINNRKRILIDEFLSSTDEQIKDFQLDDHAIEAIFDCLEHPERDIHIFKSITKRLYEIYRNQDRQLRLMTLIFIPTLIAIYVRYHHAHSCDHSRMKKEIVADGDKLEPNSSIAVLLLCIYNFEIIHQKTGDLKTTDVRLISLAKPSIYHEPNSHTLVHSSTIPTEQMLAKINNPIESRIGIFGPYHEVEQLNTGNQQSVFTVLMKIYNQHIQEVGYYSLHSLCRLYLVLLRQGNQVDIKQQIKSIIQNDQKNDITDVIVSDMLQISFTSEFLTELMRSAYFCFYNELEDLANELIEEISKRATYKFYADVILMVNAFKNTQAIISRDREDHAAKMKRMNQSQISLNATPPVTAVTLVSSRKAAITNASFKTRKLPDDIPIVTATVTGTAPIITNAQSIHPGTQSKQLQQRFIPMQHNKQNGQLSGFKNLDSINEESSPVQSSGKNSNLSIQQQNSHKTLNHANMVATKPSRKGVIHMFKEFKDKPKKSSKSNLNMETNGKIINSYVPHQNNKSGTNLGINDEIIPMKCIKNSKKFSNDDDNVASNNGDSKNVPLAPVEHFDDDIEDEDQNDLCSPINDNQDERVKLRIETSDTSDTSDRSSRASSVGLLNNSNNNGQSSNQPVIKSDSNNKYSTTTISIH